jgi:hypothetical protein
LFFAVARAGSDRHSRKLDRETVVISYYHLALAGRC